MTDNALALGVRLLTGARAHWRGCVPEVRQRIYFANHSSNLDALVLWAVLPPAVRQLTRPVAARDYWTAGPLRQYLAARVFHAVLIERRKPTVSDNPLTQMIEALGTTHSLILFPEGGRFTGVDPQPFKGGLHHLARKRPEVELIPAYLENLNRILPKGEMLPVPMLGGVTFGAPLAWIEGETKEAFLVRARQAVMSLRTP
ncbi:MAG: 1-acyl-sn-glycerol-3-phosphate acyltransferase [Verrucomicrobia bacterium]|nr:1-acyl-sn-glycerol-3-phosphate acyltransferase [Verrucomicrobiota bacterium]